MPVSRVVSIVSGGLVHAAAVYLIALVLLSAGQPLFTDDAWWHLALGREYAHQGPWLDGDPLLFTARAAPVPAAWLSDVALHGALQIRGFGGLRLAHVLCVAAILGLAWSMLRRASGSAVFASLGTAGFAALSAYRLIQLRPDLATILGTLLLYRLLLEREAPPSARRIALASLLLLVWANLHGGFLIGPVLIAAAAGGLLLAAPLRAPARRAWDLARAGRLALAAALGTAATLVNPAGLAPHRAWFVAGSETPSMLRVADEWLPIDLFALPPAGLPPSLLGWVLQWVLVVLSLVAGAVAVARWRRAPAAGVGGSGLDPARLAAAALGLAAPLLAVRFVWLGILPLLIVAAWARPYFAAPRFAARGVAAAAALALVPGFVRAGDWPMISQAIAAGSYAQDYPAAKWYAHAVWFLADAGLEGRVFADYYMGGFLGYWLAPELTVHTNGTLNVASETLDAARALRERRGAAEGEDFLALLDREGIDVFIGIHLPEVGTPNRPWDYTTSHLEGAPGWTLVFRNLRSAVYLRANARNAANLEKVAAYYARLKVPFDPERGFDAWRVLREHRGFAMSRGLVPLDIDAIEVMVRGADLDYRRRGWERLASVYAALGVYEETIRIDRKILREDPDALRARRRLVWSLLRLGRFDEAASEAGPLEAAAETNWLAGEIARTARAAAAGEPDLPRRIATLPLFTRSEAAGLLTGFPPPAARPPRD